MQTPQEGTLPGASPLPWSRRLRSPATWFGAYLLCLLAVAVLVGVQNFRIQAPYNIGDWLINYSGGFVRRGLIGSTALLLGKVVHLPASLVVVFLQVALFALLYGATWLLRPTEWRPWTVALAYSPAALGTLLLNSGGAFRKELLFLAALAVLLLMLRRGASERSLLLYLLFTAALIALSHEGLIVYWPYWIAALAISRQSLWNGVRLGLLPTVLLVALTAFVGRHPGNLAQARQICSSVRGSYPGGVCAGSIAYLDQTSAYYRSQVVNSVQTNHYLRDYSVLALLAFLPCVVAAWRLWHVPGSRKSVQLLLLGSAVAILCSLPLFVFAVDWGRWIYIHVVSLMLLLFFVSGATDRSGADGRWEWPRGPRGVTTAAIVAVYLLVWHLPPTGYEQRGWGYAGMASRHLEHALHRGLR